jgi:hypothetical protein
VRECAPRKDFGKEVSVVIGPIMRLLLATAIVVCCEDVDDYLAELHDKRRHRKR